MPYQGLHEPVRLWRCITDCGGGIIYEHGKVRFITFNLRFENDFDGRTHGQTAGFGGRTDKVFVRRLGNSGRVILTPLSRLDAFPKEYANAGDCRLMGDIPNVRQHVESIS